MKKASANSSPVSMDWRPDRQSTTPLYLQIVQYICHKISSGDWGIGSQLPPQREMAQLFGVNRSTIVTATNELMSYGLLESGFASGTRIASNTWSLLMKEPSPDWSQYIKEGMFHANVPTIQIINKLEFDDYIRLGTGEPDPDLYPQAMMQRILSNLSQNIRSLNYLEPLGLPELRQAISAWLKLRGIDAPPSCILITSGSLQALQLISICMLKRGSTIFSEAPTYLKSLQIFQSAGMQIKGIPMDAEGIQYWKMETTERDFYNTNHGRLLYTIPAFQNPTGLLMSEQRRNDLFRFCHQHRLPVIEDNAYGELWLDQQPPLSLKSRDKNGMILHMGTVSKTLAPGLRVGWLVGPESVVQRLGDVKMQIDYGASSISQWVVTEFIRSGLYDEYLATLRIDLKNRRDNALQVLEDYFSGLAHWTAPSGGYYIWLHLNKNISTDLLFKKALEHRILLNPGSIYDFSSNNALRISYSYEKPDTFRKAMKLLASLL